MVVCYCNPRIDASLQDNRQYIQRLLSYAVLLTALVQDVAFKQRVKRRTVFTCCNV